MSGSQISSQRLQEPLNCCNILNFFGYAVNLTVVSGTGYLFAKDLPDIETVSVKYQTLLSPADWAFSIWGPIFLFEGIFAFCQLLPAYRSHPLVQYGVGNWFFIACVFQSLWVFVFLSEYIYASMIAMVFIEIPLIAIVTSQQYESSLYQEVQSANKLMKEFWLLRFPFELHCGWITVATILNASIVLVAAETSAEIQLAASIVSLGIVFFVAAVSVFATKRQPRYTVALVLAWAMFATQIGMRTPMKSNVLKFGHFVIDSIRYASAFTWIFILVMIFLRMVYGLFCIGDRDEEQSRGRMNDLLLSEEIPLATSTF